VPQIDHPLEAKRLSPEGQQFFFGYYDRYALSADGRYHLALNPGFRDRPNTGADVAPLGVLDLQNGCGWQPLEESPAWNWQMGSCAQWIGPDAARTFVHNVREGSRVFGRVRNVEAGVLREFDVPIYDASADGSFGVGVNFARIHACRVGYGYPEIDDPWAGETAPDDDGLWRVDLSTGTSELLVSLKQISELPSPEGTAKHPGHGAGDLPEGMNWVNHIMISPSGSRVLFLHRWIENGTWGNTRLLCCSADGSDLKLVNPGPGVSHCDWLDDDHILAWCQWGSEAWHYYLMDVRGGDPEILGAELFEDDGHCSFLPGSGGRWMLTDGYPGKGGQRPLILFDRQANTRYDLGRFRSPVEEQKPGDIRCDLHPRWSPDGRTVTFDSIHEGYRGIYTADLGALLE
jgi:WD40-like Beta Propeller Repeat